jgi:hypothetical protein
MCRQSRLERQCAGHATPTLPCSSSFDKCTREELGARILCGLELSLSRDSLSLSTHPPSSVSTRCTPRCSLVMSVRCKCALSSATPVFFTALPQLRPKQLRNTHVITFGTFAVVCRLHALCASQDNAMSSCSVLHVQYCTVIASRGCRLHRFRFFLTLAHQLQLHGWNRSSHKVSKE